MWSWLRIRRSRCRCWEPPTQMHIYHHFLQPVRKGLLSLSRKRKSTFSRETLCHHQPGGEMSLSYEQRTSEAPRERAELISEMLSDLALPNGRLTPVQLELVVRAVADRPDLFEDLIIEDEQSRWWLLLYRSPSYEVKLLTWADGQSSDWHDHGGLAGALTVTGGSLIERRRADDGVGSNRLPLRWERSHPLPRTTYTTSTSSRAVRRSVSTRTHRRFPD